MFNHIGHIADGSQAFAKACSLAASPGGFPKLRARQGLSIEPATPPE
jgi:hypothetical protein